MENTEKEIAGLIGQIEDINSLIVKQLLLLINSFNDDDQNALQKIIEQENHLEEKILDIEKNSVNILNLHKPFAKQLRNTIALIKVSNHYENINDIIVNIAITCLRLVKKKSPLQEKIIFTDIIDILIKNLNKNILVFKNSHSPKKSINNDNLVKDAKKIISSDKAINEFHRDTLNTLLPITTPENAKVTMRFINVSKYLERLGDQIKKISEEIIFIISG